jgi:pimeloyl-ACP methyl ester carboxylesterase
MAELLAYEEAGSGPPVVFLHGITANREHWRPVADRLAGEFRCLNVDLLGHGESPRGGAVDLFGQVGALMSLFDHLSLQAPVVVGHSFGGFIATFTATARALHGVVNIDQPFDTAAFRLSIAPLEGRLRGEAFDAAFAEFVETQGADLVPPERQHVLRSNIRPKQDVVLAVWGPVLDTPPPDLVAQVEAALPAVTAPYLAVFGTPISEAERALQALIPNGRVEVWDGLGHFIQLVDPDRVADRIAAFVHALQ